MSQKPIVILFLSGLISLLLGAAVGVAADFKEYSADVVSSSSQGTYTSKWFIKPQKQRIESSAEGTTTIMIIRQDKKVIWTLMPDQHIYMETPFKNKKDIVSELSDPEVRTEKTFLGNETVDGHPTKRYHIVTYRGKTKESSGILWEATDLKNFPIQYTDDDTKSTTTWKNIKFGKINDSLFEIPAGYSLMKVPSMPSGY